LRFSLWHSCAQRSGVQSGFADEEGLNDLSH
jgi:hypothetical protein